MAEQWTVESVNRAVDLAMFSHHLVVCQEPAAQMLHSCLKPAWQQPKVYTSEHMFQHTYFRRQGKLQLDHPNYPAKGQTVADGLARLCLQADMHQWSEICSTRRCSQSLQELLRFWSFDGNSCFVTTTFLSCVLFQLRWNIQQKGRGPSAMLAHAQAPCLHVAVKGHQYWVCQDPAASNPRCVLSFAGEGEAAGHPRDLLNEASRDLTLSAPTFLHAVPDMQAVGF